MGQEGERGEVGLGDGALERHRRAATVSSWSLFQLVFHPSARERAHLVGMLLRPLGFSLQGEKKNSELSFCPHSDFALAPNLPADSAWLRGRQQRLS